MTIMIVTVMCIYLLHNMVGAYSICVSSTWNVLAHVEVGVDGLDALLRS